MPEQSHHHNTRFIKKRFPITVVCDRVHSPANIGSVFRIADSFGIEQIYFCGQDIAILSKRMQRTARSTHEIIPYKNVLNSIDTVSALKSSGYTIVALEITDKSVPVSEYQSRSDKKIALIIGEENFGVSKEILEISDKVVHINMYGNNSSMNVATAAGIALYEITKQLNVNV